MFFDHVCTPLIRGLNLSFSQKMVESKGEWELIMGDFDLSSGRVHHLQPDDYDSAHN